MTNPNVQQRWHDLEFYVADSYKVAPRWTVDFGLRFSHMQPPFMADDQMGNFVQSAVNPALGDSSCNGIEYPPGTNPCTALGIPGGSDGPNRQLVPTQFLWFAPRLGVAWDVNGERQDGHPRRHRPLLPARSREPGPGRGHDAAVLRAPRRHPDARLRRVGHRRARPRLRRAPPTRWSRKRPTPTTGSGTSRSRRRSSRNTKMEVAYVGSKGLDLFGQTNLNEVAPANRLAYAQTGNAALRPLNGTASIGDGNLALWQHNRDSIYHSPAGRVRQPLRSRLGARASYTWSKLIANTGVDNADGPGLSYNNAYTDSTQPDLDRARGANDARTRSTRASSWPCRRFEDKWRFVKNVFGDWEFTSIVQAGTGYPITVYVGSVPGLSGNGSEGTGSGS